jgi:hypothetical protein
LLSNFDCLFNRAFTSGSFISSVGLFLMALASREAI